MSQKLQADRTAALLPYLIEQLPGWSRTTLKQRLKAGCISVNGNRVKKHDFVINSGDQLEIDAAPKSPEAKAHQLRSQPIEILYQDQDLVAINKPAGLLSVSTADENKHNALAILRHQLSRRDREIKLWPVHRLDRDTSGVLLFATSSEIREAVISKWAGAEKTYLAVVQGQPEQKSATINQPLRLDEQCYFMHVGEHPDAKPAVTHYQTAKTQKGRSLLHVQLETGRQHQIRAHLAWLGHPVIGDPRYGQGGDRLGLHALRLRIVHPTSRIKLEFETPAPADFLKLMD